MDRFTNEFRLFGSVRAVTAHAIRSRHRVIAMRLGEIRRGGIVALLAERLGGLGEKIGLARCMWIVASKAILCHRGMGDVFTERLFLMAGKT